MNKKTILPLILEPNITLHQKSQYINKIDYKTKEFCKNLITTMKHYNGMGIAAVQVGILKKIIVISTINLKKNNNKNLKLKEHPIILINPKIIKKSQNKKIYIEGCLSFGNTFLKIERFNKIKVKYLDLNGRVNFLEVSNNIIAACLQHEIDHTDGITLLDRLSKIKKDFMIKKYLKWKKKNI